MKKSKQRKCIQINKLTLITIKESFHEKKKRNTMSLITKMSVVKISLLSQYNDSMSKITSHHNTVCYKLQTLKKENKTFALQ